MDSYGNFLCHVLSVPARVLAYFIHLLYGQDQAYKCKHLYNRKKRRKTIGWVIDAENELVLVGEVVKVCPSSILIITQTCMAMNCGW